MSTLEVDALTVSLGETVALKDVTFTLKPGELLVVLGPTGAGKTTLLRAIAGLQQPDRGNITFYKVFEHVADLLSSILQSSVYNG